jgi:hypothetical protein
MQQAMRQKPSEEVQKRLDALAKQVAANVSPTVLPKKYRQKLAGGETPPSAKPMTDKERKGKQLGAKKGWMPIP